MAVPMELVVGVALQIILVVAARLVPVEAPAWHPPLAGAPPVGRDGRGLGLGDGSRAQTGEPQADRHYEC